MPHAAPDPALWPETHRRPQPLQLRHLPLLFAAVCFAVGELLARLRPHPFALLLLALLLLTALAILALAHAGRHPTRRPAQRVAVLPVAALWIAVGTLALHLAPAPDPQLTLRPFTDNLSRTVVGSVVRARPLPPRASTNTADAEHTWQPAEPEELAPTAEQVDLALSAAEHLTPDTSTLVPVAGGIRLTLFATPAALTLPDLHCGDRVELPVRLRIPERYRDPGAWQYADYLLAQGISAHGSARVDQLERLPAPSAPSLHCRLLAAQSWAANSLTGLVASTPNRHLPRLVRLTPDDSGMLAAMLVGDRSGLNRQLRLGFERTGSFHLFVVSGMHVALLAGLVFALLRRLRVPETAATLITLPLIAAYAVLTGFGAPVQRALFMTTVFLLARLLSRDRSSLNALGAAALLALLLSPNALFEASFQMTVLAIIAIAGIAVPLGEQSLLRWARPLRQLPERRLDQSFAPVAAQRRLTLRLWSDSLADLLGPRLGPLFGRLFLAILRIAVAALEFLLVAIVAELVMALPMAVYFHRATLFALPANLLSLPLIGILLPAAILTFAGALLSPLAGYWLAIIPGVVTAALLHLITAGIGLLSRHPLADARVPPPSAAVIAGAILAWALCCWAARRSRPWALATAVLLPLVTVAILWPEPSLHTPGKLELTAIDVGQGDSLLLVGAEGRTMLIDAGGPTGSLAEAASATAAFDVGEEVVAPYLWSRRIRRLDTLVLSHAHSDHMGGMPAVLRDLRPRELWVSLPAHANAFNALLDEAKSLGVPVRFLHAGQSFPWGEQQIDVLAPEPSYTNPNAPKNDDSLVLRVRLGRASVLLEGDAEAPSEQAMLRSGNLRPVTLLKVGHHGSLTSTTPDFLAAVSPADAVISTGLGNRFGHPRPEILARLAATHARTFRTDEFGLTTFLLTRDGHITSSTGGAITPSPNP